MKNSAILSGLLVAPPLYYFTAIGMAIVAGVFFEITLLFHPAFWIVGSVLIALSIVLALWAKYSMIQKGTTTNSYKESSAIVTSGPFQFSRNPMYLSITTLTTGLAFAFNDWILLILTGVAIYITNIVIRREEHYLTKKFGQEYLEYKKKVRRWM
ncbi:MAG: hypothetical protein COA57_15860 [Flavobacteriales bacterium]|nr:isoprenylcysteine carboxylmethyltransferase family protein [Bacteroidales bacterium AH-315-I05]PCJ79092.1 MAG: hypothetical protein COA57_15860 [Flavobacteriales bacterium]